jgi:hypothetical protein
MATYYVRPDGNNSNTGLGATTGTAWATIQKALGATGIASGDTVYIAPGVYTEAVTIGGTYSAPTYVIGNPTASQFSGVTAGVVNHTGLNAGGTATTIGGVLLSGTTKSYLKFSNIYWSNNSGNNFVSISGRYNDFTNCVFEQISDSGAPNLLNLSPLSGQALDSQITKCIFFGGSTNMSLSGSNVADTTTLSSCSCWLSINQPINLTSIQVAIYNCTIVPKGTYTVFVSSGSATFPVSVYNCVVRGILYVGVANSMVEDYNRLVSGRQGTIAVGANTTNAGAFGFDIGQTLLFGISNSQMHTSNVVSPNRSYGTATNAPATDLYGIAWAGTSPDAGSGTFRTLTSTYTPTERNASAITIAPASTSQSIELYLGATGLTFATSGLAAYFVRNREAPTPITLVTQTPTGAWASGGFAEISSSLVPGVYRLDVPNAAFSAGASDVTIVVRGASGTNGAVLTVTLSSGGLTAAQTASAVWDEPYTSHTTASTFGARTLKTTVDNRNVEVGTSFHIHSNVHAIVDSTAAADELKGALLHNGTDYISADLLTPVSAATSVHIGPYQLLADGLGADQPLDVNVGTATSIDVQVTDANGTGIDITGATVTAKVYSSTGTLVASYAGTATYADNGRLSFGLTTTVTNTSGTYTITVTRTTGATDTQIFGPLRLYVRPA